MADELIPLSSLLGEDEETQIGDLIPLSSLIDQSVKRVPTAMDRGVDVPLDAQVQEPARDLGFFGRTRERFSLGSRVAFWDHVFAKTDPQRFVSLNFAPGEDQVHCAAFSDKTRQTNRPAVDEWNTPPAAIDAHEGSLFTDPNIRP